jgi:Rab family protein
LISGTDAAEQVQTSLKLGHFFVPPSLFDGPGHGCPEGQSIFVGDQSVGKTMIISSFKKSIDSTRLTGPTQPTVAMELSTFTVQVTGTPVSLQLSDTAGMEQFCGIIPLYARRTHVVFNLVDKSTFDHVVSWIHYLRDNSSLRLIVIVGNKTDLVPAVVEEDISELARGERKVH